MSKSIINGLTTKTLVVVFLITMFAFIAVSAQQITEQSDSELSSFFRDFLKTQKRRQQRQPQQADPVLTKKFIRTQANYILTDEELVDKGFWKMSLKIVGEIGKAAIKDCTNKNWDENPEEENSIKFAKLFKAVLPYLKHCAKQYVNKNLDTEEISEKKWFEVLERVLPYIKAGVKGYIANKWYEDSDKKFWSSVWQVIKSGVKEHVNKKWYDEMETYDKLWVMICKVVMEIKKGAIKSYVNEQSGSERIRYRLPRIKSGIIKPQSDKFSKKIWKIVRDKAKEAGKQYLMNIFSADSYNEEADAEKLFKDILRKIPLPPNVDYEKIFGIVLPKLRNKIHRANTFKR